MRDLRRSLSQRDVCARSYSAGCWQHRDKALFRHNLHGAWDPDDPMRRLLLNGKANLAPPNVHALRFTIEPCEWQGTSDISIDEVYGLPPPKTDDRGRRERSARGRMAARDPCERRLAQGCGPIDAAVSKFRISKRSPYRAAEDLSVERETRGFGGPKYWRLPIRANVVSITAGKNGIHAETRDLRTETSKVPPPRMSARLIQTRRSPVADCSMARSTTTKGRSGYERLCAITDSRSRSKRRPHQR